MDCPPPHPPPPPPPPPAPPPRPPPPPPPSPSPTCVPPKRPADCCRVISDTHTSAWPDTMAAAAKPKLPAAPPTARRQRGREPHLRYPQRLGYLGRIARIRIDGKTIQIRCGQPGVLQPQEDRLARHLQRRLRQGLTPPVIRRRPHPNDCPLILQIHDPPIGTPPARAP